MLYTKFKLFNGLTVIHHPDPNTRLCVVNILYKVGSRNENKAKTGFAHLFEHLMFGGSVNIPDYDEVLQYAGGDNNAFTSNDITNYYLTVPHHNIETGLWLESDRMLSLDFNEQSLNVQKNVVMEEFKERYLNQPYGDVWLTLLPLAYRKHPYSWPTIGKELSHIQDATMEDVKRFFYAHYAPNNAILVIAGNISLEDTKALAEKWFGDIPRRELLTAEYEPEPLQTEARKQDVSANVPADLLIKAYHMPGRMSEGYYATDLLSDILGSGKSSRLYLSLVKEKQLFSDIECYITGDVDPGLLVIEGRVSKGVTISDADHSLQELLYKPETYNSKKELEKVINKTETSILYNEASVLNRAQKLAYCEFLGDIALANNECAHYQQVTTDEVMQSAMNVLKESNASTLYYTSEK